MCAICLAKLGTHFATNAHERPRFVLHGGVRVTVRHASRLTDD